ncbi:MAG TPA: DinB family protein, partial [Blastocatellia bacterium]|nr:DinB family protein [Blastocatellia bacterium]
MPVKSNQITAAGKAALDALCRRYWPVIISQHHSTSFSNTGLGEAMAKGRTAKPFVLSEALLDSFATNERINQYLIENLDDAAWRAEPPGGKGRTAAAIVAHMHNVRVMWLKAAAKGSDIPDQIDRHTVTRTQAIEGMRVSYEAIAALLRSALESDGKIKGFRPDVAGFIGYLISHDAHHRGQLTMLARQAGHP